jgi:cyclic pyranopterin monophosphate synthase
MTERHPESEARMVDVTSKEPSAREARARCVVHLQPETVTLLRERELPKGDVLEVARIAAITGAKKTSELIPLCHPIAIGGVEASFDVGDDRVTIDTVVRTVDRTGVEMEALTAAAAAALSIYDMVKGVDRSARITDLELLAKSGGRSGSWKRNRRA